MAAHSRLECFFRKSGHIAKGVAKTVCRISTETLYLNAVSNNVTGGDFDIDVIPYFSKKNIRTMLVYISTARRRSLNKMKKAYQFIRQAMAEDRKVDEAASGFLAAWKNAAQNNSSAYQFALVVLLRLDWMNDYKQFEKMNKLEGKTGQPAADRPGRITLDYDAKDAVGKLFADFSARFGEEYKVMKKK